MTNKKLIRYAIASQRIREVARNQGWGAGSPMSYQLELADDYEHYALSRSGLKNGGWSGLATGCLASMIGAVGGAVFGAIFIANGDENGLVAKTLYKMGAGIGGFVIGGLLAGSASFARLYIDEKTIHNIVNEREKRRKERGYDSVTESQTKRAYGGLIASESDRFDVMTENRFPKLSANQLKDMSEEILDGIREKPKNE